MLPGPLASFFSISGSICFTLSKTSSNKARREAGCFWCLTLCLESQGCHFIPFFYLLLLFCLVSLLLLSSPSSWDYLHGWLGLKSQLSIYLSVARHIYYIYYITYTWWCLHIEYLRYLQVVLLLMVQTKMINNHLCGFEYDHTTRTAEEK